MTRSPSISRADRARDWLVGLLLRLPVWLRPAVVGALILGAIVTFNVVCSLPDLIREPRLFGEALVSLLAASGAGALGGFAYSLVGRRLLGIPWVGRHLAGIVCVAAYLFPLLLLLPRLLHDERSFDPFRPGALKIAVLLTLFFGVLVGQFWFEASPRRSTKQAP